MRINVFFIKNKSASSGADILPASPHREAFSEDQEPAKLERGFDIAPGPDTRFELQS